MRILAEGSADEGTAMEKTKELLAFAGVPLLYCVLACVLAIGLAVPMRRALASVVDEFSQELQPGITVESSISYDPAALKKAEKEKKEEEAKEKAKKAEEEKKKAEEAKKKAEQSTITQTPHIDRTTVATPFEGDQVGQLVCERIGIDCPVMWNDTEEMYAYGAGQDVTSFLPGFGKFIVLSGHCTTYFAPLQYIAQGDVVQYHTAYGDYEYTVSHVDILNEMELQDILNKPEVVSHEQLIMYTCYPFTTYYGRRTDRYTVFAERTAGMDVR